MRDKKSATFVASRVIVDTYNMESIDKLLQKGDQYFAR